MSSDAHTSGQSAEPQTSGQIEATCSSASRTTEQEASLADNKQDQRNRFKSASRAILFFKRAATSLGRQEGAKESWTTRQRKLIRQQTADSCISQAGALSSGSQFIVPQTNGLKLPLVCLVKSVDGELMREVFVHRYELGSYLIESLKVSFGISDCKYFGLKLARSVEAQDELSSVWLDLDVAVSKQLSKSTLAANTNANGQQTVDFYLRLKFYPPSIGRIQEPFVRHYLWLQLRRDLRLGKLTSSTNNLAYLMACVLQYELADHSAELLERVPQLQIVPNQDLIEHQAIELWRDQFAGSLKHQAQMQFLRAAVILETYGFDYYPVRDHQRQRAYLLGFNYAGVKSIRNGRIVHHFRWTSISKISNERRMLIFHVSPNENSRRKQILGFKCLSLDDCRMLYLRLVEQKVFFTLDLAYFDKSVRSPAYLLHASNSEPLLPYDQDLSSPSDEQTLQERARLRRDSSLPTPPANLSPQETTTISSPHQFDSWPNQVQLSHLQSQSQAQQTLTEEVNRKIASQSDLLAQIEGLLEATTRQNLFQISCGFGCALWSNLWRFGALLASTRLLLAALDSISGWLAEWLSLGPTA